MENFSIPETMKAMTLVAYDKLQLATVPVPKPGPGEVLCRIKSVAICGSDPKMIHGDYAWTNWPPYYPFIMGHEWAGQIVALGEGVNDFKVGDRVAGEAHVGCGKCDNCKKGHYTVCLNYGKDGHDGGLDMGHRHYGFYWQGANAEYNVYKTSALHIMAELPARKEEVEHAEEEGIVFKTLTNPTEVLGDENGWVKGMTCVKMELGEPDASGRRRPIVKEGSEFVLDVDTMIMALGTSPNPLIRSTTPGLDADKHGCLITNGPDGLTSRPMVYAGGDAVTGAATVILAMGAGKEAARAIEAAIKATEQ